MLGVREAGDVTDGRQNGDGGEQSYARQLDQQGDAAVGCYRLAHLLFQHDFLLLGEGQHGQVRLQAHLFQGRDLQLLPPGFQIGVEQLQVLGRQDVMAVQHRVQAVLGDGTQLGHLAALRSEDAQIADVVVGHPDAVQHACREQLGQGLGGFLVGLDLGVDDSLDVLWMDDQHVGGVGIEQVVDLPGVGGHFDDDRIGGMDLALDPGLEVLPADSPGTVDHLLLGVYRHGDHEVLVDIQTKVTLGHERASFQATTG